MIAKLNKTQVKLMRKLKKSTSSKRRGSPALESVCIAGDRAIATNGQLLTIVNDAFGLGSGTYTVEKPGPLTEFEPSRFEFPNWERIEPKGTPELTITLDAALMRDALESLDGNATISVRERGLIGITGTVGGVPVTMAVLAAVKR